MREHRDDERSGEREQHEPGPLSAEARHGKIRALRALGRREAEAQALEDFLRAHPDNIDAAQLRRRLDELQTP